ncbi:MAG: methionyl aminopeptidase [Chlamydiia bacterium]|nr:methionyl aminopeptidase [Chlamydiia bacterium]
MTGRNDPCFCGSGKKWKKCCAPELPPNRGTGSLAEQYRRNHGILIKTEEQIAGIRRAGHLAAKILTATAEKVKAGVTTEELNAFAHQLHMDAGARPAPLHYGNPPFPKSICTSLNDVICHGIPNDTPLKEGDILNIDVTCVLDGYYGDCSRMVTIGSISPDKQRVVDVSYECLMRSVALLRPGVFINTIGETIEAYAHEHNCSVVSYFVAHGVGLKFHEKPNIPHNRNSQQIPLIPGMTFTVEPMINAGSPDVIIDPNDQWTARTPDGLPSAQWEHTLLITPTGHEILTPWDLKLCK